jgi:hypothetical protein
VTAPGERLRQLPVPVRPLTSETAGSFLSRLALANSLRIQHVLALTQISSSLRYFSPATDDTRGWSPGTPQLIADLAGRPLPQLAAAIPLLATMTAASTTPVHACRRCAAAKGITGMVIIRARPGDYLCTRHQQWLRGLQRPALTGLPEIAASQRRHDRRTRSIPDNDIARAHQQARNITAQWLESGLHPELTSRWRERTSQLAAMNPGPRTRLDDVITHPEMLAVACLLITAQHSPASARADLAGCLGFPYRPHPLDPLQASLAELAGTGEKTIRDSKIRCQRQEMPSQLRQAGSEVSFDLAYAQLTPRSSDRRTETGHLCWPVPGAIMGQQSEDHKGGHDDR